jgi:hypothetical protein
MQAIRRVHKPLCHPIYDIVAGRMVALRITWTSQSNKPALRAGLSLIAGALWKMAALGKGACLSPQPRCAASKKPALRAGLLSFHP